MFETDKVFYNGVIHTMKEEGDVAEAMAVFGDRIVAIGTNEEVCAIPAKEKIDLEGKTVIPGMIDTHIHLYMDYLGQKEVDLSTVHSFDEICEKMKSRMAQIPDCKWLEGKQLHMERLEEGVFPTCDILDTISTKIPVIVKSFCGHANILNSKALEMAGIDDDYVPEIPGTVEHFEDGRVNGIVREETYLYAMGGKMPEESFAEAKKGIAEYLVAKASEGLTTMHTNAIDDKYNIELFQALEKEDHLAMRVVYYPTNICHLPTGAVSGFGNDMIKIGAMKMFMDGSVGAASCAMNEPFADVDTCGLLIQEQEETNRKVKEAYDSGFDVAVHAIGDRAIDMILTAFEKAYDPAKGWNQRFYLIHGYVPTPEAIERMKNLPLVIPTQPVFIRNFVGMVRKRLGEERTNHTFPLRTMLDAGLLIGGSSDAPVQATNPFYGIECAVTRKDTEGHEEKIAPKEAISVYEAIDIYTRQAAYVAQEEKKKGTLEVGKLADFLVLESDVFTVAPSEIHNTKVETTYLGGRAVYSAK